MKLSKFLQEEWRPALGCTEPASIAYAAARAASLGKRDGITGVHLVCDPRIYKNCYAVGVPHSEHKVGILWTLAIGALLPDPSLELECFRQIDASILEGASRLLEASAVSVEVDSSRTELFIEVKVERGPQKAIATIEGGHTRLTKLEVDKEAHPLDIDPVDTAGSCRERLSRLSFDELIELTSDIEEPDREALRRGMELNEAISRHGLGLLPKRFVDVKDQDPLTRVSRLVCAGVHARMTGEDFTVMSLAGSGNKGIVCSVPLSVYAREAGHDQKDAEKALALACLLTSATTHHLGTLSAVCGCSNAAGIGLAAGLVLLEGGGPEEISMAVNNMVGNVTGMICDGAKIGCAMKTMTSVDAAFRSTALALSGIGIPFSDGIVGRDGAESLRHLGKIATRGMSHTDEEILRIMQAKLGFDEG